MPCHEQVCLIMFNEKYYFERYFFHHWAIVGTPPPFCSRGLSLQPNFQKVAGGGGLAGPQILDGGCWERGGLIFSGGLQFSHKNKLKSEIFNDGKNYKQKYFSVIQTGKFYLRI